VQLLRECIDSLYFGLGIVRTSASPNETQTTTKTTTTTTSAATTTDTTTTTMTNETQASTTTAEGQCLLRRKCRIIIIIVTPFRPCPMKNVERIPFIGFASVITTDSAISLISVFARFRIRASPNNDIVQNITIAFNSNLLAIATLSAVNVQCVF